MARLRAPGNELARLLDSVEQPIYVVDDRARLVFCNRALADWTGRKPADLLGRRCAYHCSPQVGDLDADLALLCPPPEVDTGGADRTATVACRAADGRLRRRAVRFVALGDDPGETAGVLALVAPADLPEDTDSAPLSENPVAEDADSLVLHDAVRRFRQEAAGRYRADRLIGQTPAIRQVRRQVELAAASRASVTIAGPPGSGRQHIAAAIHYAGAPTPGDPLIPVACSVLGADLIRSTMVGLQSKGPETSGRSTLLLSDADELPGEVQAELVRLITSATFRFRAIATATRPLAELAARGSFSESLAAALGTIAIALPPLEQRREDVPLLAQLFLEEANTWGSKQLGGFTAEAMDLLVEYSWPGNVDELVQMVAQVHRTTLGSVVTPADLPKQIHLTAEAAAHPRREEETIVLDEFLGRIERELLARAMQRTKGNKAKAARLLGLTRARLYRRLLQLGLEEEGN